MGTATNNGTYNILKNTKETGVTILELSSMCAGSSLLAMALINVIISLKTQDEGCYGT